jgi:thiol-disulfide isomerase/thioredoxin
MSRKLWASAVALLGLFAREAQAGKVNCYANPNTFERTPALKIGDAAPALAAAGWVNGAPVPRFEAGTVYLVEFWATWCLPCQKSLPHMNELQRTYRGRGLRVVGVTAAENDGLPGVKAFLQRTRLDFPVAYVEDEAVFERWMWGARESGLPWVFVIDRGGRIAWWGQPSFADFDDTVRRVVDGKVALPAAEARRASHDADKMRGWRLKEEAFAAYKSGDRARALPLLDELIALDPERFWFEVVLKVRLLLNGDRAGAVAFARTAVETLSRNNPHALAAIADTFLGASPTAPELALAERAAEQASRLTAGVNPDVQQTLASIAFMKKKQGPAARP